MLLPEFSFIKHSVQLFLNRYRLRIQKDDLKGALEDLRTAGRIADQTRTQPFLIGTLVVSANDTAIIYAVAETMPTVFANDELHSGARQIVESIPEARDLKNAFLPEAFSQYWVAEVVLPEKGLLATFGYDTVTSSFGQKAQYAILQSSLAQRPLKAAVLDIWIPVFEGNKWNDPELFKEMQERISAKSEESGIYKAFFDVVSPVYEGFHANIDSTRAYRRCLLAAFDVLDDQSKVGEYPPMLENTWVDPFGDKPLRYKVEGDGFRIWSIGGNGTDEHGLPHQGSKSNDIVVIYPPLNPVSEVKK